MTRFVSIIIPCYRQAHWLATAVDSALAQLYTSVEVVVVNDGSDDDTHDVALAFGNRIRYICQPNRGLAAARNAGVRASSGELLLFLDSDDALHPEAISKLFAATTTANPLTGMGWRPFETNPAVPTGSDVLPPSTDRFHRAMLTACYGPPHNFLIGRSIFEQVGGFDEQMRGCADWDLWLRLLFAGATPNTIPFVGAWYRQSSTQMSRDKFHMDEELSFTLRRLYRAAKRQSEVISQWNLPPGPTIEEIRRRAVAECANAGYLQRNAGHVQKALCNYLSCIRLKGYREGTRGLLSTAARMLCLTSRGHRS